MFDGRYQPIEFDGRTAVRVTSAGQFNGIGENDDAYPSIPLVAAYRDSAGATLLAYWLPWQPQEYTPKPATITLRVPGAHFTEPVLVNLLDGSVHTLPAPQQAGADTVFDGLPLFDFPLVIVERTQAAFGPQRSTPGNDAIPQL